MDVEFCAAHQHVDEAEGVGPEGGRHLGTLHRLPDGKVLQGRQTQRRGGGQVALSGYRVLMWCWLSGSESGSLAPACSTVRGNRHRSSAEVLQQRHVHHTTPTHRAWADEPLELRHQQGAIPGSNHCRGGRGAQHSSIRCVHGRERQLAAAPITAAPPQLHIRTSPSRLQRPAPVPRHPPRNPSHVFLGDSWMRGVRPKKKPAGAARAEWSESSHRPGL